MQRRFWWILIAIVAVAFAIRWAYILEFRRDQASCNLIGPEQICGDAYSYHAGANLLADGRGYIDPLLLREDIVRPGAIHPPAYVTYLGLWSMLGARSVLWHQFASVVLGLGTVVVTALFGRDLISERVGLLAASAMAVYPYVWFSDGAVMSESMALLAVACAAWAAARFLRTPSTSAAGLVGGGTAFAMLSRSEFALYLPLVVVVGLLGPLRSLVPRARLGRIAVAGVIFASLSAPWVVRNLTAFHHPVVITTGLGLATAYANCDTTYEEPNLGYWSYWCAQTITVGQPGNDESDEERLFRRQALDYIDAHRSELPKVLAARFLRQWNLYAPNNQVGLDVLI
ncbi:MAG: glycosyltransferase family 39 protein, partial [Acidimicrobiia bacterium]